jgi:hypothetical protein
MASSGLGRGTEMRFRVLVNGKNLLLVESEGINRVGFVATKYVDALTSADAQCIAIRLVRAELSEIISINSADDPMEISCLESEKVSWFRGRLRQARGFTFYAVEQKS